MNIVWTRRISQIFFLAIFIWISLATLPKSEPGSAPLAVPLNFFLYADPLIALSVWLASGVLAAGFVWAFACVALTLIVGRFYCGWVCPLGTLQQVVGWLARFKLPTHERVRSNAYRRIQGLKYAVLIGFLFAALAAGTVRWRNRHMPDSNAHLGGSLQTGLLDPVCLATRGVDLALLPLAERWGLSVSVAPRSYVQAIWTGGVLAGVLLLCLWLPRFYCRYVCPLGALFGILARWSFWRIGKTSLTCSQCLRCERDCEGACSPSDVMRPAECVLCFNCLHVCPDNVVRYGLRFPDKTQTDSLDIGRRGFLVSAVSGLIAIPLIRLGRQLGTNFNPRLIRPPGSRSENDFLARCIKCGQCMHACPTNIIQPAALEAGPEGVWSPVLNYRIGTSGCLPTCVACGKACPTGAIRELTVDERLGRGPYESQGPIRMGLAFVDRGRCLPWAMNRPCIVCQEVCPVSPKAIYLIEHFTPVRSGTFKILKSDELTLHAAEERFRPGALAVGDFYVRVGPDSKPRRIIGNTSSEITLESLQPFSPPPPVGAEAELLIRLQQPVVDPRYCIGCGICEHHCPITGQKAIRVTAENESRHPERRVTLQQVEGGVL